MPGFIPYVGGAIMLRIGEFSVLSQISIYMLRHYSEIGLLIPERTDPFTGYRYYSENQLPIANKIRSLKNMGLSLSLIKEILTKYTTNQEAVLWKQHAHERNLQNIQLSNPAWNIAKFHNVGFVEENLDVEIQQTVVGQYKDTEIMKFKTVEEITAATLTFRGKYELLPEANEAVIRWIADNHYELTGSHFNIYHISPETEQSIENMITEVCFPIFPY